MIVRACLLLLLPVLTGFAQQNAGYPLAGKVVDARTGAALAGAEVQIAPVLMPQLTENVVSSANGEFRFDHVAAGKYMLAAARRRYVSEYYLQNENYNTGIAVGPGLVSTGITFPMHASAAIFGRVLDEDSEPVPNARIYILRGGITNGGRAAYIAGVATTDNDGRFRQAGLREGAYFLAVVAEPWFARQFSPELGTAPQNDSEAKLEVAYPVTFYPGTTADDQASPVALSPGAQAEADFMLRLVPAAKLLLTDSASGGSNTAHPHVGPYFQEQSLTFDTHWGVRLPLESVIPFPNAVLFSAAPGRYTVHAAWSDSYGRHSIERVTEIRSAHDTLDVAKLPEVPTISATVTEPGGAPSGRAQSLALRNPATLQILRAHSLAGGRVDWSESAPGPGKYELVLLNSEGSYIRQIAASNARVTSRVVEFTGKTSVELKVSLADGKGALTGKVEQATKPMAGAMVLLLPEDFSHATSLIRRDQSDSDGTFSLANIVPGRYTLIALPVDRNLEYTNPQAIQPYLGGGKQIDVVPNGKYEVTAELTGLATRADSKR